MEKHLINKDYLTSVINNSPGPLPWYVAWLPCIDFGNYQFEWIESHNDKYESKVLLRNKNKIEEIYLILNLYTYVKKIADDKIIVWYEDNNAKYIKLLIFNLKNLITLKNIDSLCVSMRRGYDFINYASGLIDEINIPLVDKFPYSLILPRYLTHVEEMLILAHYYKSDKESIPAIYFLKPNKSIVDISILSWFNADNFDLGYQWITRVARDEKTGCILGDGIRIRNFVLSRSGSKLLGWVTNEIGVEIEEKQERKKENKGSKTRGRPQP